MKMTKPHILRSVYSRAVTLHDKLYILHNLEYKDESLPATTTKNPVRIMDFGTMRMHKIDYSFLSNLGIDMNNLNPQYIQLLGNGGEALPEDMVTPVPDDIQENAIHVQGEADGKFDQDDYILFYAKSTSNWTYDASQTCFNFRHSNNPYSDKTYYYIKIANQKGKRISTSSFNGNISYTTDSYDNLKHYEVLFLSRCVPLH